MKTSSLWREAAGRLIVVALIYAPFALGSIPPPAPAILELLIALAALSRALDAIVTRTLPRIPRAMLVCVGWLLLQGWFMAWNAHGLWAPAFHDIRPLTPPLPFAPGAIERTEAVTIMLRLTALSACLLIAVDLARDARWQMRFLWAMAWTGAALSILGLVEKVGLAPFVAARMSAREGDYFATYNYHANAGAFLNLAIPAVWALLCIAIAEKRSFGRRLPAAMLGCCLVAAMVNTSRGAQGITLLLVIGLGVWRVRRSDRGPGTVGGRGRIARGAVVCGLAVWIAAAALHRSGMAHRWKQLPTQLAGDSSRMQVWGIALATARESGPFGQGAGSFKLLLPRSPLMSSRFYSHWIIQWPVPGTRISMWSQAHEDYLQTWVEFGWVGGLVGAVLLFGGIARVWAIVRGDPERPPLRQTLLYVGVFAALIAVAGHATFDFPLQVASLQLYVAVYLGMAWAAKPMD